MCIILPTFAKNDILWTQQFLFATSTPMAEMEQFFLAYHYLMELDTLSEADDPDEDTVYEITNKAAQWINLVQDGNSYKELAMMYHRCMYDIYCKWNNDEGINHHGLEYQKCEESTPKQFRAKIKDLLIIGMPRPKNIIGRQ